MKEIRFYYENEPYGCFSNFYQSPFHLNDRVWNTVEHYYQAQKAVGTSYEDVIHSSLTPDEAKRLGNAPGCPVRSDWSEAKVQVMRQALKAKYTQNDDIRKKLIETGNSVLIENSMKDYFWGCGEDGTGKSMLGKLLMELREELNNEK